MRDIELVQQLFDGLSDIEKLTFVKGIKLNARKECKCEILDLIKKTRYSNGMFCPKCGFTNVIKWGKKNEMPRFKCKNCGKTFTLTSRTAFFSAKKELKTYEKYLRLMNDGFNSIRKSAQKCKISTQTSFQWRHKFLDLLKPMMEGIKLNGIVEADETFMSISYKGARALPRDPHKRGTKAKKRGLSTEKVCIPCAVSRNRQSISKISNLGKVSTIDISNVLANHIEKDSMLFTDCEKSYIPFAESNHIDLFQCKANKVYKGIANIQHINNYHSLFKRFIKSFNGVATKYLNNYLLWYNFRDYGKGSFTEWLKQSCFEKYDTTSRKLQVRSPLPILK